MKFLVILSTVLMVNYVHAGMDKEQAQEMFKGMAQECKDSQGATDQEVNDMAEGKYPETRTGKCLAACLQKQFGVVKDEKKLDFDGFMAVAKMGLEEDPDKMKLAEEIARECETITDPDECELAMKIGKCLEAGAKKRDIKMM
ncbi:unnamed protein product [Diamesa hyperborea]